MSAAFSSRSSRFNDRQAMMGPRPGDYNPEGQLSMAAEARRRSTPRNASFGGSSSRDLPWQKLPEDVPRGTSPSAYRGGRSATPRSEELASVPSTFGSTSHSRGVPSAAFAGQGDRFAPSKVATPGPGAYTSGTIPLSPSKRVNRSASFNSKVRRFGKVEQADGPGPGQFQAKRSDFAPSERPASQGASGFGSRSVRASPFAPKNQDDVPPGPEYNLPGAFSDRGTQSKANGSAGFASRSSRFGRTYEQGANGADPGQYDAMSFHSMASKAGKSFNQKSASGSSAFGTSARSRPEHAIPGGRGAYTESPGPAAYEHAANDAPFGQRKAEARPSAAFASKSKKDGYVRQTESPSGAAGYNPDERDSMAANAARSFNRKVGSASFGSRAAREVTRSESRSDGATPGPGAYENSEHDPTRPTCEAQARTSSRRKSGGWGASSAPRAVDPTDWQRAAAF